MNGAAPGLIYHQLIPRNTTGNTTHTGSSLSGGHPSYKYYGLALAVASGLFIGVSFVLKKYGLLKANAKYNEEAGEGYGYLKNAWWWGGMTLMILGEICNFAAYLFADAILVTPLGALSVVITAILSGIFLKERLSFVGKMGCFNCIIGAVVIAANAPEQSAVSTIQDMQHLVLSPGFLTYAGVLLLGCAAVAIWVAPKYGKKSMMVYLTVCSLTGGLSVICIQGIGAAITAQARGIPQFNHWFVYVVIVFVIATLVTEIIYLNKALNLYNAALVTPTYYVYFTSATIVSGAVLYRGFKGTTIQIITVVLGFFQICSGVVLLQLSKSAKDVPDTAVFSGDLDQVRTVAEQEEPEYEPRADTISGKGAILRAISTRRQKRETKEVQRMREEHMASIHENEPIEWDGLRRRRTLSSPGSTPNIHRRKTVHPPLGMSQFPNEDDENEQDPDNGMHPGFWSHFKRKPVHDHTTPTPTRDGSSHPMDTFKSLPDPPGTVSSNAPSTRSSHIFGLPSPLRHVQPSGTLQQPPQFLEQDTAYHGADGSHDISPLNDGHIHFVGGPAASAPSLGRPRGESFPSPPSSPNARLASNGLPREGARRQFSFQNVFRNRSRSRDAPTSPDAAARPQTRSALSFTRRNPSSAAAAVSRSEVSGATEEERLGLVRGDSSQEAVDELSRENTQLSEPPRYESGTVVRRPPGRTGNSSDEEAGGGAEKELGGEHGRSFI